jgi:hypothetical protein
MASSRTLQAMLALGLAFWSRQASAEERQGLRWVGDARVAAGTRGSALFGPALRFRYGLRLGNKDLEDGPADRISGSFMGGEISAGLLLGAPEPNRFGTLTLVAFRLWLSRHQPDWFLRTERWSVLGALLPEVGATFGMRGRRLHLGWDLPLGPRQFQVVPGVVWFPTGTVPPLLFTLAFRVPM